MNCKVSKISDVTTEELLNYDNIVFGGWLHAGKIKGFKDIYENIHKFKHKNLIFHTQGHFLI